MPNINDAVFATGLDEVPGMFENEVVAESVEEKIRDQKRQIAELTPKLQDLLDLIDSEIKAVDSVSDFEDITKMPDIDIKAELQARAKYKKYLGTLKTKFTLALQEAKK